MTALTWMFAIPLIAWMAAAGLGALTGHKIAAETFDRLGYTPLRRAVAGITELVMAAGVLIGAALPNAAVAAAGTISANLITGLTWFVIGNRRAGRGDKAGAWAVTFLATGYLVALMFS